MSSNHFQVSAKNHLQHVVHGLYDVWTHNHLTSLIDQLKSFFEFSSKLCHCVAGWVNRNDYEPSSESFGILLLSVPVQEKLRMLPYHNEFALNTHTHHGHLVLTQGTQIVILSIHTPEKRVIFCALVKWPNIKFTKLMKTNWIIVAYQWMDYANGQKVFYKVHQ